MFSKDCAVVRMAFDTSSMDAGNDAVVMGFVGRVNDDDVAFSVMATTGAEDDDEAADCCVAAVITAVLLDIFEADFPRMS